MGGSQDILSQTVLMLPACFLAVLNHVRSTLSKQQWHPFCCAWRRDTTLKLGRKVEDLEDVRFLVNTLNEVSVTFELG
jgi:hypothetical protein